jgi:hypothetical protein
MSLVLNVRIRWGEAFRHEALFGWMPWCRGVWGDTPRLLHTYSPSTSASAIHPSILSASSTVPICRK